LHKLLLITQMQSSQQTKTAFQRLVHQIGGSEACHIYHLVKLFENL